MILIKFFVFFIVLIIAYFIYALGFPGDFLFDDYTVLSVLENFKYHIFGFSFVVQFIFSFSDGTRALALLSFLINDSSWPSDPFLFKHTNVLLHLLNAVLIFWLIKKLLQLVKISKYFWIAFFTMVFWLLHPLHVSTVLYIVQRMVELSVLFTLAGLISYIYARELVILKPVLGYIGMTLGLVFFGILALFSKEIGVLLLFYVLIIEFFWLRRFQFAVPKFFNVWSSIILYLPIIILIFYFIFKFDGFLEAYQTRNFTLEQRLLTEPVILFDYIKKLFLPFPLGLWQDDFPIMKGLFQPWYTFIFIFLLVILLIFAFLSKKRIISFAIVWFLAGHLIESTFIPLELYFEHRNYLPFLGPIFAIVWIVFTNTSKMKPFLVLALMLFLGYLTVITVKNTMLWSNQEKLITTWLIEHPTSLRAQHYASLIIEKKEGLSAKAKYLKKILDQYPNTASIHILYGQAQCVLRNFTPKERHQWIKQFESIDTNTYYGAIEVLFVAVRSGYCKQLTVKDLEKILFLMLNNPHYVLKKDQALLYYLLHHLYQHQKDLNSALVSLKKAYQLYNNPNYMLYAINIMVSIGLYEEAEKYLTIVEDNLKKKNILLYWAKKPEFEAFYNRIQDNK